MGYVICLVAGFFSGWLVGTVLEHDRRTSIFQDRTECGFVDLEDMEDDDYDDDF